VTSKAVIILFSSHDPLVVTAFGYLEVTRILSNAANVSPVPFRLLQAKALAFLRVVVRLILSARATLVELVGSEVG
jgi:hypothetical protein